MPTDSEATSPPCLVTGATGFIGRHLVARLRALGQPVRVLIRQRAAPAHLAALDVEVAHGDIRDPAAVTAAARGCQTTIHAAGVTGWVPDRTLYESVNYEGTRNLLGAARTARLERIVHVSSVVTIGEHPGQTATEQTTHRGSFVREYERTKFMAEEKARAAARTGLNVIVVNPTGVIGPHLSGIMRQVLEGYLQRRLPAIANPDQRLNLVHVADVTTGVIAAYRHGKVGERYILGGENLGIGEMFAICEELTGIAPPTRTLPYPLAWSIALAAELGARVSRGRPAITRDMLRAGRQGLRADSSKAARELEYSPRPARESLRQTLAWLRSAEAEARGGDG